VQPRSSAHEYQPGGCVGLAADARVIVAELARLSSAIRVRPFAAAVRLRRMSSTVDGDMGSDVRIAQGMERLSTRLVSSIIFVFRDSKDPWRG